MATKSINKNAQRAKALMLIDEMGGPAATARFFALDPTSVINWRTSGIPRAWEKYLRLARPKMRTWKAFPEDK